jgi:hypothetical protein
VFDVTYTLKQERGLAFDRKRRERLRRRLAKGDFDCEEDAAWARRVLAREPEKPLGWLAAIGYEYERKWGHP